MFGCHLQDNTSRAIPHYLSLSPPILDWQKTRLASNMWPTLLDLPPASSASLTNHGQALDFPPRWHLTNPTDLTHLVQGWGIKKTGQFESIPFMG